MLPKNAHVGSSSCFAQRVVLKRRQVPRRRISTPPCQPDGCCGVLKSAWLTEGAPQVANEISNWQTLIYGMMIYHYIIVFVQHWHLAPKPAICWWFSGHKQGEFVVDLRWASIPQPPRSGEQLSLAAPTSFVLEFFEHIKGFSWFFKSALRYLKNE